MKALQILRPGEMALADIPRPAITEPTQVLIRVHAAGICGSDIHLYHGRNPYAKYPRIPGHEIVGVLAEVGSAVTGFAPGDRVVIEPIHTCGHCYPCRIGRPNVCERLSVYGCHVDGGFAEYMLAYASDIHHIPAQVSDAQAAMIEPFTIGAQAMYRTGAQPGETCLIHGAGPIGCIALVLAKHLGLHCLVSEPSAARRQMASQFGADLCIDPTQEVLSSVVSAFTQGRGMNIILDAAGIPALVRQSIPLLSAAGRFLEFGYGFGSAEVDFDLMNKFELTVMGLRHQTHRFAPIIAAFPDFLPQVDAMQTHHFPLEAYAEAFRTFEDKRSGACKVVFTLD